MIHEEGPEKFISQLEKRAKEQLKEKKMKKERRSKCQSRRKDRKSEKMKSPEPEQRAYCQEDCALKIKNDRGK